MNYFVLGAVGVISGICAALGIGGGFVLLIYLTAIISTNQLEAQLLNLIFFIPIAGLSLILHIKHKLVDKKFAIPCAVSGTAFTIAGAFTATVVNAAFISKIFAVLILIIGVYQFFSKQKH